MPEQEATLARFRQAAALASGPAEVIDFLLPLWAASELDATPATIGLIVAVEAVVSLVVRPGAGVLADRHDRSLVAAGGAALSAGAFVLYAVASSVEVVGVGAALGGAGGALFWVALRADVGTHLDEDPAAYARVAGKRMFASCRAGRTVPTARRLVASCSAPATAPVFTTCSADELVRSRASEKLVAHW